MQIDKSIKAKLLKFLFGIALMTAIFGMTSITAKADKCGGSYCGCPIGDSCKGSYPCVVRSSRSDSCRGHQWDSGHPSTGNYHSSSGCCDHAGYTTYTIYNYYHCPLCNQDIHDAPQNKSEYNGGPYGHQLTGWQDYNDSYHVIKCTASWHSGCDGSTIRSQEAHNSNGAEYQRNDWYWHRDCSTCGHSNTASGPNQVKINTYGPKDNSSKGANWSSGYKDYYNTITLPGLQYNASTHLYGFVEDINKSGTFTINQTTGAKAYINFAAGASQSGGSWCSSARNQHYSSRTFYSVWMWNYVKVNYYQGFGQGLVSPYKTLYVDASGQTLKAEDQISRTGYDIVSKGWFRIDPTLATNNKSNTKHTHKYAYKNPNECGDTAHIKFGETRNAYNWCKDVNGGTYADLDVTNNYQVTLNIAPHWRAHQLTIEYDENIKTGTSFPGTILGTQIMYYDDGYNYTTYYNPELYSLSALYPTRNGYTFMGWGVSRNWCTSRYASNSAVNESQGIKQAYDYTTASKDKRLAQDWATIGGKDLAAGDQTITLYAQWERIISYKFFYYKEGNKDNYDCNTSTVAFHNDDNEYLYMDIYMKRCCEAAFSVQKDADSGFFLCKKLSRPSHYRWTIF